MLTKRGHNRAVIFRSGRWRDANQMLSARGKCLVIIVITLCTPFVQIYFTFVEECRLRAKKNAKWIDITFPQFPPNRSISDLSIYLFLRMASERFDISKFSIIAIGAKSNLNALSDTLPSSLISNCQAILQRETIRSKKAHLIQDFRIARYSGGAR